MNLVHELLSLGITWTIGAGYGKARPTARKEEPVLILTITFPGGAGTLTRSFRAEYDMQVQVMLAAALKGDVRVADLMRRWCEAAGDVVVSPVDALFEAGGAQELLTLGLRKRSSSSVCAATYGALCRMHPRHRELFWTHIVEALENAFQGGHKFCSHRHLAETLRSTVHAWLGATSARFVKLQDCGILMLEAVDVFAFNTFKHLCETTSVDDWMRGWLGLAVEPAHAGEMAA